MVDNSIIQNPSIIASFIGGLVATLTPCVYPLIPITLSIVGAGKESSRPKAIYRAALYCFGIFSCYTTLGIFAVVSGSFFGEVWSSPSFRAALGLVLCAYAIISLDLINFKSEGILSQKAARLGGNSAIGAFAAGAMSGVLAAPCTGALLATILTLAASNPDPSSGMLLLLAYAAGFSIPFFILSLSPRAFSFIPKSGSWLYGAKYLIGTSLLALGFYYLLTSELKTLTASLKEQTLVSVTGALILLAFSIKIGIYSYLKEQRSLRLFSALISSALITILSFIFLSTPVSQIDTPIWVTRELDQARAKGSLVLLDFTADWCVKCKELAQNVFANEDVKKSISALSLIPIDLSEISAEEKDLQKRYKVKGLPSILFLCPSGEELNVPRVAEVVSAKQFLDSLELAKEKMADCRRAGA